MRAVDRAVIWLLAAVVAAGAFWFGVMGPRRDESSRLAREVSKVRGEVDEARRLVAAGAEAREAFTDHYRTVIGLGKAVPEDADTASLLVQIGDLSERAGAELRGVQLAQQRSGKGPAGAAEATEEVAATLPIGAAIGPAGLPVMPYTVEFRGGFFEVANLIEQIDRRVRERRDRLDVRGRLLTVDGFSLTRDPRRGFPSLTASLSVTSYLTPPSQGVTAGATAGGPAPVVNVKQTASVEVAR